MKTFEEAADRYFKLGEAVDPVISADIAAWRNTIGQHRPALRYFAKVAIVAINSADEDEKSEREAITEVAAWFAMMCSIGIMIGMDMKPPLDLSKV